MKSDTIDILLIIVLVISITIDVAGFIRKWIQNKNASSSDVAQLLNSLSEQIPSDEGQMINEKAKEVMSHMDGSFKDSKSALTELRRVIEMSGFIDLKNVNIQKPNGLPDHIFAKVKELIPLFEGISVKDAHKICWESESLMELNFTVGSLIQDVPE